MEIMSLFPGISIIEILMYISGRPGDQQNEKFRIYVQLKLFMSFMFLAEYPHDAAFLDKPVRQSGQSRNRSTFGAIGGAHVTSG